MGESVTKSCEHGYSPRLKLMQHSQAAPSSRGRNLAFGSVVAGGGFALLLLAGITHLVASLLGIEVLLLPARVGLGVGLIWFIAARLARVGTSL